MKNFIEHYFECLESPYFGITQRFEKKDGIPMIEINTFVGSLFQNNKCFIYRYYPNTDNLIIDDYAFTCRTYRYPNFSKLTDEAYHFQKMTQWDYLTFNSTDVINFIEVLNEIQRNK